MGEYVATMSTRRIGTMLMPLILGTLAGRPAPGEDADPLAPKSLKAAGIEVDVQKREVRLEATVCLSRGILEYLVCLPGTFEHETIFTVNCKPSQIHMALLAIGLVPRSFAPVLEGWEPTPEDKAALVSIAVEYEQDSKPQRRRIVEFLVNRERKDGKVADRWIFTGSDFFTSDGKARYAADITGVVIGLIPEGAAVVRLGEKAGVPYRGDDQGLEINADTIPPVGTKVRLIFTPHDGKGKPAAPPAKGTEPVPPPGVQDTKPARSPSPMESGKR